MAREGISHMSLLLRSLSVRLRGLARLEKQIRKRRRKRRKRRRRRKAPELCPVWFPPNRAWDQQWVFFVFWREPYSKTWNRGLLYLNLPSTTASSTFVQHFKGTSTEAYTNKKAGGRKMQFHLLLLLPKGNEVVSSQPLFHLALAVSHLLHMAGKCPPSLQTPVPTKTAYSPVFSAVEEIKPRFDLIWNRFMQLQGGLSVGLLTCWKKKPW